MQFNPFRKPFFVGTVFLLKEQVFLLFLYVLIVCRFVIGVLTGCHRLMTKCRIGSDEFWACHGL
jgi:hypothetical protein